MVEWWRGERSVVIDHVCSVAYQESELRGVGKLVRAYFENTRLLLDSVIASAAEPSGHLPTSRSTLEDGNDMIRIH